CEWAHSGPTGWRPTVLRTCRRLDAADGAHHQISHEWNFVGVELQRHSALYREFASHLAGGSIACMAANRIFDSFEWQGASRGRIHCNADVLNRVSGKSHR